MDAFTALLAAIVDNELVWMVGLILLVLSIFPIMIYFHAREMDLVGSVESPETTDWMAIAETIEVRKDREDRADYLRLVIDNDA